MMLVCHCMTPPPSTTSLVFYHSRNWNYQRCFTAMCVSGAAHFTSTHQLNSDATSAVNCWTQQQRFNLQPPCCFVHVKYDTNVGTRLGWKVFCDLGYRQILWPFNK
ncbi:hypothetical protein GOODEAATRI_030074 [Goodea atripinnis]|uniref:Uncharacterized protein n=1 Tax=Goodea atripinnis TaxID=208336 RepID=A0ABV0N5H1_9TELE